MAIGAEYYGNADSASSYVLPALLAARPLSKVVWVERPLWDVANSLRKAGYPVNAEIMFNLRAARRACNELVDVGISFEQLNSETYVRWLWDFLFDGHPWDRERWLIYKDLRLVVDPEQNRRKNSGKFAQFLQSETEFALRKVC